MVDDSFKVSYNSEYTLGIDYGSRKIGLAIVDINCVVVAIVTVNIDNIKKTLEEWRNRYKPVNTVAGKTKPAQQFLPLVLGFEPIWVDEQNSTIEARALFYKIRPKQSLIKYIRELILYLLGAYHLDGWAAAVIALRYLNK